MASVPSPINPVIPATFDGAVFRPNGPVSLPPNTEVLLTVEPATAEKDPTISFLDTASNMNLQGPADWASKLKDYLCGDRRDAAQ
jgi:hypothetical protein